MTSPYEDDATRLMNERKKELKVLEEKGKTENGFFGKRKLKKEIRQAKEDIEYLETDIKRYQRALAWNRKKDIKDIK
tara:strand:+ start:568 stop:798 length:231 start_codon:yes stop_codon:yes gene_type:complete